MNTYNFNSNKPSHALTPLGEALLELNTTLKTLTKEIQQFRGDLQKQKDKSNGFLF